MIKYPGLGGTPVAPASLDTALWPPTAPPPRRTWTPSWENGRIQRSGGKDGRKARSSVLRKSGRGS